MIWATGETILEKNANARLGRINSIHQKIKMFCENVPKGKGIMFCPQENKKEFEDESKSNFIDNLSHYDLRVTLSIPAKDDYPIVWIEKDLETFFLWLLGENSRELHKSKKVKTFSEQMNILDKKGACANVEDCGTRLVDYMAMIQDTSPKNDQCAALEALQNLYFEFILEQAFDDIVMSDLSANLNTLTTSRDKPRNSFQKIIYDILFCITTFRENTPNWDGVLHVENALQQLLETAEQINKKIKAKEISLTQALFAEYILGLSCFECLILFGVHLAQKVLSPPRLTRPTLASWDEGLKGSFKAHSSSLKVLNSHYQSQSPHQIWSDISDAFCNLDAALKDLVQKVVSLRGATTDSRSRVTLAQIYHWSGWGGVNNILRFLENQPQHPLYTLWCEKEHHFDWHNQISIQEKSHSQIFCQRQTYFSQQATPLTRWARACTAALLREKRLASTEEKETLRIWGDAVGPKAIAEHSIIQHYLSLQGDQLQTPRKSISFTLTDIAAFSIHFLTTYPLKNEYGPQGILSNEMLFWRDLNQPLKNDSTPEPNSFDCYSCSVSLHQIADREQGHDRIVDILSFATKIVRPFGVISLPDVGAGVAVQVYLLPINLVDREGGWEGDVFSLQSTGKRIASFQEVACKENGDPRSKRPKQNDMLKCPLPIFQLWRGTPLQIFREKQFPVYNFIPYIVKTLSWNQIKQLDELWNEKTTSIKDKSLHIRSLFEEDNINLEDVSKNVEKVVSQLFQGEEALAKTASEVAKRPKFLE